MINSSKGNPEYKIESTLKQVEKVMTQMKRSKTVILRNFEMRKEEKMGPKVPYLDLNGLNQKLRGSSVLEKIMSSKRGISKKSGSFEENNLNMSRESFYFYIFSVFC
jgi:hypothetical protein